MKVIVVTTQKELNVLPTSFEEFTEIQIKSEFSIEVNKLYQNSQVRAYDSSQVRAYGSSQVTACDSSQVTACESSQVTACDSSQVRAYGSSQVTACDSSQVRAYGSSQVTAYGSSQVRACGSSQVRACGSSQVTAYGSSQVRAYGSSQVRAYGSSQVTACDSSQVTAYGSSQVTACESSQVTACDSSQVRAYGSSQVRACGSSQVRAYDSSQVTACGNSMIAVLSALVIIHKIAQYAIVALDGVKVKLPKKARTATVIRRKLAEHNIDSFIDFWGLTIEKDSVILYKTVNKDTLCDFKTGKIKYEGIVICPDFDSSKDRECGGGLHLCATPQGAKDFADGAYKLLKCKVKVKDIVVYIKKIDKVRCRKVEVLEVLEG